MPTPEGAEYRRVADDLLDAALDEPPESPAEDEPSYRSMEDARAAAELDSETQVTAGGVLADEEEAPGVAETSEYADIPLRMRIPAVSEVRDDAASGEDARDGEEESEVFRLTRESEGVAAAPAEPAREDQVDDEVLEVARESSPEPRLEEQEDKESPSWNEGSILEEDEPDEVSPDSQALEPEEAPSPPEPEEKAAPATAAEEDLISLIQRERAEDDAFSHSAAAPEEPEAEEDAEALDFSLEDDVEELVRAAAPPPAASHEAPANTPSELIRELVADICPGDLLLAENMEQKLPAWTPGRGERRRHRSRPTRECPANARVRRISASGYSRDDPGAQRRCDGPPQGIAAAHESARTRLERTGRGFLPAG